MSTDFDDNGFNLETCYMLKLSISPLSLLIHLVASTSLDCNLYDISHSSCGLQLIPFLSQPVLNIIWKSSMIIIGHASGEKNQYSLKRYLVSNFALWLPCS